MVVRIDDLVDCRLPMLTVTLVYTGHTMHVLEWFERSEVCAVADCDCKCFAAHSLSLPLSPPASRAELTLCNLDRSMPRQLEHQGPILIDVMKSPVCTVDVSVTRRPFALATLTTTELNVLIAPCVRNLDRACPDQSLSHLRLLQPPIIAAATSLSSSFTKGHIGQASLASQAASHRKRT